jgi:hypothetical protein
MNTTISSVDSVSVGLDVSKDTLDACLLIKHKRHEKQFANDEKASTRC